mmetsp:Transcript_35574/g.54370  ORF Transcript_35574/g.54370 Transcript_35574/m.54370 type:complete len:197 (-) Transcript_35574:17-607(-)
MFAEHNNLKGKEIERITAELQDDLISKVQFAICKCHAKFLISQHNAKPSAAGKAFAEEEVANQKTVKFDNLFDQVIDATQDSFKAASHEKISLGNEASSQIPQGPALLNVLREGAESVKISQADGSQQVDLSKVKLNKQFKLMNPLPKLRSVPATPHLFEMAGAYITYPNAEVEAKKYEVQGGLFSSISGFFGGKK